MSESEKRFRACREGRTARQIQAIWRPAKSHGLADAAAATACSERWVHRLCERYNAEGPEALGDRRRNNGAAPSILTPEVLDRLRQHLAEPPADAGVWTSRKVADVLARELGREQVAMQRGSEALKALGWSLQRPRPRNPRAATPEAARAFKSWRRPSARRRPTSRIFLSSSMAATSTASA
ncbi:helix-turn-helix domain-containing protein [Methylobacterium aquaticum]|uniref:helix-turn-helix domain-containing protein n=1 Tax=Methylobacterium aquaticum TaxID=270351 RepID=UPI001FEE35D5|nr:helix-turn-helix domain-containing protein [Methylobacterium aquaticum]